MSLNSNISLTPAIQEFLENKVAAGIYKTLNDAINATIGVAISNEFVYKERINALNAEIQKGLDDVKAGRVSDALDFLDELIAENE